MSGPVLLVSVQGGLAAAALADLLGNCDPGPQGGGGWRTLKVRGEFAAVKRLGDLIGARTAVDCCRCAECAGQSRSGRDCLGAIPRITAARRKNITDAMRCAAQQHRARGRTSRAVELESFAAILENLQ